MWRHAAVLAFLGLAARPAEAFTIGSAFTDPCHEKITLDAFLAAGLLPDDGELNNVKGDPTWAEVADYLTELVDIRARDDRERFILVTLLIGIRNPDNEGFGLLDVMNLRAVHLGPEGQSYHSLRTDTDDGDEGTEAAVGKTRAYIVETLEAAYLEFQKDKKADQTEEVGFFLEYYGTIEVRVWKPLFLIGAAAHALEDSFPHTYRSSDLTRIYAVCNFIEGISRKFKELRDGPRHSSYLDECNNPEVAPLRDAATLATTQLFAATREYFKSGDIAPVMKVLDTWLVTEPGCGTASGYCGTPWAALAKLEETLPLLSCSATSRPGGGPGAPLVLLMMAVCGIALCRSGRRPSPPC